MKLCHLKIEHLRNISSTIFEPAPGCNLITGDNGAGKTSLLEAVYLLARAKSFRTAQQRSPIQKDKSLLTLFAEVADESNHKHRLGLSREGASTKIRLNGHNLQKLSELVSLLPVLLITPNSHRIIEEGPEHRRRLLNWGVFHVEHEFKSSIQHFNRALLQRNNALRKGTRDLAVWNKSFIEYALSVNQHQTHYFKLWKEELLSLISGIDYLQKIEVTLSNGWSENRSLDERLLEKEPSDRDRGFSSVGPHRVDIHYKLEGEAAKQRLSRGQQKVLISCALIAQSKIQHEATGRQPIMLFDDMDSELDIRSLKYLLAQIQAEERQVLITTINPDKFTNSFTTADSGVFHVEHGCVTQEN